jgi:Xaa-Pro dipeptidase
VASLLVTAAGKRYYFTTRMKRRACTTKSLARWTLSRCCFRGGRTIRLPLLPSWPAAAWLGHAGRGTQVNLAPLRAALSESEIARYRWLGAETASATVEALNEVEPGLSEYDLEAITEAGLLRRGILPSVALYAVDERIFKYKHAVPRGKRLKQYGMLNLCSRKWGLAISITRFIHFGTLPEELAARSTRLRK